MSKEAIKTFKDLNKKFAPLIAEQTKVKKEPKPPKTPPAR